MTDAPVEVILQNLVQRLSRSLLQYVAEAFPWTTPREKGTLAQLRKLVAEEQDCAGRLVRFLQARRVGAPPLDPYLMAYTSYNFASLDFFLPLLVDHQRQLIADLEKAAGSLWSDLEAREQVQHVLEVARMHLQALEAMAKAPEKVPA